MSIPPPILDHEPVQRRPTGRTQLQKVFRIIELSFWAIFVIGLLLKIAHLGGGAELLIISITLLVLLYIFTPILVFGSQRWARHIGSHAVGIAFAFLIMAVLFKLLHWQGFGEMATLAVMLCVPAAIITFIIGMIKQKKWPADLFYWGILARLTLGLFVLFLLSIN